MNSQSYPIGNIDADLAFWDVDGATPIDTSEGGSRYLLSGQSGVQIKITSSVYILLKRVSAGSPLQSLANDLSLSNPQRHYSSEELAAKYQMIAAHLRQVREDEERSARGALPWGFWFPVRIIPQHFVSPIARVLSTLFRQEIALSGLFITVCSVMLAVHRGMSTHVTEHHLVPSLALYAVLLLCHEFGHASACARFGEHPRDISFIIYLIYPAFYSDVTAAWRLKRVQSVVVDLGGCYFQSLASAMLIMLYLGTHWEPLRIAVIFGFYSLIFSLNPIFKFDGYWALADLLGVVNLGNQPKRIVRHLLARLCGTPTMDLPWPIWIIAILFAYSALTGVVWSVFTFRLIPTSYTQLQATGIALMPVLSSLTSGHLPSLVQGTHLVSCAFFLTLLLCMLWSITRVALSSFTGIIHFLRKAWVRLWSNPRQEGVWGAMEQ